jgi:hypothetical protein
MPGGRPRAPRSVGAMLNGAPSILLALSLVDVVF